MERKEIIQVNGVVIVIVMVIIANALAIGIIDRFYIHRFFALNLVQSKENSDELARVRQLKNEIILLEGAPNWNATTFVKNRPESSEQSAQ